MRKHPKTPASAFAQVQKKYGLKDPALIQRRIIFINVMSILKLLAEDNPRNRLKVKEFVNDFNVAEKARIAIAP